jgi:hypothetical protein
MEIASQPSHQQPCPLTAVLSLSTILPFVIPSEAEGSAVSLNPKPNLNVFEGYGL